MIIHQINNSAERRHYNAFIYDNMHWVSHFHKCYELIYAMDDNVTVVLNGTKEILSKGELLLIYPYTVHQFDITKAWVGVFSGDFIQSFSEKREGIAYARFFCNEETERFLSHNLFVEESPGHYMLKACLYLICDSIANKATTIDSKINPTLIEKLTEYITENLTGDISLESVSQVLGYEYHYVSKLFHDLFHMNFKEYLNLYRFQYSCDLLVGTDKSITEIASHCGFQSIRNFNRVFKGFSGMTPGEFKKGSSASKK